MATMRPDLSQDQLNRLSSRAEAKVYAALKNQFPDDILIIHSLAWVYRRADGELVEGESDFSIFFPDDGYVTIEVKGGGIGYDPQTARWESIDKRGKRHTIKDPFAQARRERFAILDQ